MNLQRILRRLDAYERLIRLDKPIGALLLGWPTLWAVSCQHLVFEKPKVKKPSKKKGKK